LHRGVLSGNLARALFRAALVFFLGNRRVITLVVADRKTKANIASADIRADLAQDFRVIGFDQGVARVFRRRRTAGGVRRRRSWRRAP